MAYYDALIAAWNGAQQPPAGVTGIALTGGMTTQQKLDAVNAWTVAGPASQMIIPTYIIYNAIDPTEFSNAGATNQQLIRDILSMGTVDVSLGTNVRNRLLAIFGAGTQTRTKLSAAAASYDATPVPWWRANGYSSPFNLTGDIKKAGLT
jgi:hypothetical protein